MQQPWVVDARSIDVGEDIDKNKLIVTPDIAGFLDKKNNHLTVLVAPKGYGKTLLLKAKRISIEGDAYNIIPHQVMIDTGPGSVPTLSKDQISFIAEHGDYWRSLWKIAICLSVLRRYDVNNFFNIVKTKEVTNQYSATPFQFFSKMMYVNQRKFFEIKEEFDTSWVPIYTNIHSQMAIFIDNIDEYFENHLVSDGKLSNYHGNIDKSLWYKAQIGLVGAIYDLRAINPHIKVFASIRTEAWNACKNNLPNAQNIFGSMVMLKYSKDDLKHIFKKNINMESGKNLFFHSGDAIRKFFGNNVLKILHTHVGIEENIDDYISRHTLWRPRDFMIIGKALSGISPNSRDIVTVRSSINSSAREICIFYLAEIVPHLKWLKPEILSPLIKTNILSEDDLVKTAKEYNRRIFFRDVDESSPEYYHVFCDLYRAGLLGCVVSDPHTGKKYQHFQTISNIGEDLFRPDKILPKSDHYLIHPTLSSYIHGNGTDYAKNINKHHIVDPGSAWMDDNGCRFVVVGDIFQYNATMQDANFANYFPSFFSDLVSDSCKNLQYFSSSHGDSIIIVDRNIYHIINAIHDISTTLEKSRFAKKIRFGMDYGFVSFNNGTPSQGIALLRAARLEALAQPGSTLLTKDVEEAIRSSVIEVDLVKIDNNTLINNEKKWNDLLVDDKWFIGKDSDKKDNLILDNLYHFTMRP